jgi:putative addiction module antidote
MLKSKVTTVGSSTGVVLPKEIVAKLRVEKGDTLCFVETPNGFEITPYDPEFEQEMNAARSVMRKYRNALRELAQ